MQSLNLGPVSAGESPPVTTEIGIQESWITPFGVVMGHDQLYCPLSNVIKVQVDQHSPSLAHTIHARASSTQKAWIQGRLSTAQEGATSGAITQQLIFSLP